jgi:hypothetical protein
VVPGRKAFRWRHRTRAIEIKDLERVAVDHRAIGCAVAISSAAVNAVLAAVGYNFNLLQCWFEEFLRATFLIVLSRLLAPHFL